MRYLLLVITFVTALSASSQQWEGQWTIYPVVGARYDKICSTADKVYFLSSGAVYSYDADSGETYFYNTSNKLSGTKIKNIYGSPDGKYVLIIYADGNMDMLYDDGKIYNLPEIKHANTGTEKIVNSVAFGNGYFAVATNFGIVVYDEKKREVKNSGIYRQPVDAAAICGDNIMISLSGRLMSAKLTSRLNNINSFVTLANMSADSMSGISGNMLVWRAKGSGLYRISTVNFDNLTVDTDYSDIKVDGDFEYWKDGYYFKSGNVVRLFDNTGMEIDSFPLGDGLANTVAGLWIGKNSVWLGGVRGTANFDMSRPTPVIISDWYRPESATCSEVAYFYLSPDGERIYAGNLGPSNIRSIFSHCKDDDDGIELRQTTDVIEGGRISDVSIIEASTKTSSAAAAQTKYGDKAMYGGVTRMAEDPENPDTYFIGNGLEGLYVVKDRKEIWKFDVDNAPFHSYWHTRVFDVNFDPEGNLWVGHAHNTPGYPPYVMLPAAKLRKGYDKISKSDWVWPRMSDFNPFTKDFISYFCKKSNYAIFLNSAGFKGFYVLDTKGSYDNVKDDVCIGFASVIDQDGNTLNPEYYYAVAEDSKGRVWLGSGQGIYYIDAASGIDADTKVVRPKVPRNDGTNFADFLLHSDHINSIAVDPSDRKWIATDNSGVYLVSADGDRIINHFDTSNSPLPSSRVTSVICDPLSNTVYFGTTEGLFSYKSDSSPARDNFDDVYAYPNPVRPDYTGWVTIAGLMDGSLVKITDSAGNVLYQGRSEGGMLSWDACNSNGERVRTGIYYVYASSGGNGQSTSGSVTKIMVVN